MGPLEFSFDVLNNAKRIQSDTVELSEIPSFPKNADLRKAFLMRNTIVLDGSTTVTVMTGYKSTEKAAKDRFVFGKVRWWLHIFVSN